MGSFWWVVCKRFAEDRRDLLRRGERSPPAAVMGAFDGVAVELGKGHERNDLVIDVRTRHPDRAVGALLLQDLENDMLTGRADRNYHDAVRAQLNEQRRRNVKDAEGENKLVEW